MTRSTESASLNIRGVDLEWQLDQGTVTFARLPITLMWTDSSLAGLMAGVHAMVGTERFVLALQREGRKSVEADWQLISKFPEFKDGFAYFAETAAIAGWGRGRLASMDLEAKQARFIVENSWEGRYQKALGVCWGSAMIAGKLAGYGAKMFDTNCWAEQTAFIAKGDAFDEFLVQPSSRTIESEMDNLLKTDKATEADMAVALRMLEAEVVQRRKNEEELTAAYESLSSVEEELRAQCENLAASEEMRRQSEERWQFALEGAGDGVWDWNTQTNKVFFSHRWKAMLGYSDDEIGDTVDAWDRLLHPEDKPAVYAVLNECLEGKTPFYMAEQRILCRDGTYKWILDRGKVFERTPDGKPLRMIGTHTDITERKRIEESLSSREALLSTVLQSTADGIIVISPEGEVLTANERFYEVCGISEELRQKESREIYTNFALNLLSSPQEFHSYVQQLINSDEESWNTVEAKDGRFFELYSRPLLLDRKRCRLWSVREITKRKLMEIELRESQAFSRCLFTDSSIPLVVLDPVTGRFTDCNPAAVALYGYQSRDDVLGKKPVDVSTETQYDGTPSDIAADEQIQVSLEKGSHSFEWRHQRPDGEIWDAEVQLMRFEYQQRAYLQFSLLDITQSRRAQRRNLLLNKLYENLLLPGSLSEKLKLITDTVIDLFEADFARIWLVYPGDRCSTGCTHAGVTEGPHVCKHRERCLHLITSSGRYTHLDGKVHSRVPFGCYKIGRVAAAEDAGFVTNNVASDPRVHDHEWARSLGLVSFAGFRLLATDGSPAGVLAFFSQHHITDEEQAVIESLANTTSLVVQTAQAIETLRYSEDKFARAFRVSPDALVISRVDDGMTIEVNDGFCALTGYTRDEIINKTTLELGLWDNPANRNEFVSALRTYGRISETEYNFRNKFGEVLECTLSAEVIYIGDCWYVLSIVRDISKRKKAEMELLREKQFTEKLLEGLPGIFFLYDSTGHLKRWNKAHETATGFNADELRDRYISDWHETPAEAEAGMAHFESVIGTGIGGQIETTLVNKEGRYEPYLISTTGLLTSDGPVMMGVGINLTKRKQAEDDLLREKQFTEKLLESLPGIFFLYDSTCHLKRWNKSHETSMGFTADELRDWYIPDWHETPEDAAKGMALVKSVLETGVGGSFETTLINKEGRYIPYLITVTRLMTPEGPAMMGVGIDITERKQIEEALSESEKRFRSIALNLPGVVYQFYARKDGEMGFSFVSDRVLEILGADEIPSDLLAGFAHGLSAEDKQRFIASIRRAIQDASPWEFESYYTQPSGRRLYIRALSQPEELEDQIMFYGVLLDITDRRRAEEEREQLTAILDSTSDVVVMFNPQGGLFYLNAAGRRTMGWDETTKIEAYDLSHIYPDWALNQLRVKARPVVDQSGFWQGETAILSTGGREIPVSQIIMAHRSANGNIEYYSSIMRDITERKRVEQERLEIERRLLHSQKLESLGVLAGGIAHDFNNLLMAISGNLDLALHDLSPLIPARQYITHALQASQRASDLTRQMLAYSGKGRFVLDNIDLAELVLENAHLLRASIAKTVTFELNAKPGLPLIEADPGQLQQVIMNLITNASEALDEQAGVITITTGVGDFDEAYLQNSRVEKKPSPGRFVYLEVVDTGCGMDETTLSRIFDPFYTTKFTGRGLGMAAVLGIVSGHRGAILVSSQVDQGSVIRVLFPVMDTTGGRKTVMVKKPIAEKTIRPLTGKVLIVDDEAPVRQVCRSYLAMLGLETLCAADGEEAIRLFDQHAAEIACVVLDLNMPRMDGVSAFRAMKHLRPDVQVVLCSGYNEQEATQHFLGEGLAAFIQKPFRLLDLKIKIEQILMSSQQSQSMTEPPSTTD